MKHRLLIAVMMMGSLWAQGQSFVSTEPQKRNVLIEEYTGVNCQYCPLGHKATDRMMAMFPGRVLGINIHQGTFAMNSGYTTEFGNALAQQASVSGYPSGTVNRHRFAGGICLNPGEFYPRALEVMEMDAPVNVAAALHIDPTTRQATVTVEAYYTANSSQPYNLINVALIQNNVMGYQSSAATWYPENIVNGEYRHSHMLRYLITGQWGDTISQTTAGSCFSKTYTFGLGNAIGSVPINDLNDMEVLVFVCEGHSEVLNATKAIRTGSAPYLAYGTADQEGCGLSFQPYVTVVNPTEQPVSQLRVRVDGTDYVLGRTLPRYGTDTIHLAPYVVEQMSARHENMAREAHVTLVDYVSQGQTVSSGATLTFTYADVDVFTVEGPLTFALRYDSYAEEISFNLEDAATCEQLFSAAGRGNQNNQTASYRFSPATAGLYRFTISDIGGDGLSGNYGFYDGQDEVVFGRNGKSLMSWSCYLNVTNAGDGTYEQMATAVNPPQSTMGIAERSMASVDCRVWPSPATDVLNVEVEGLQKVELMDFTGRVVMEENGGRLSTAALPAGIYIVRATTDCGVATAKIVKK